MLGIRSQLNDPRHYVGTSTGLTEGLEYDEVNKHMLVSSLEI